MEDSVKGSTSAQIRARLEHPIVDSDGHLQEFFPAFVDVLREVGGQAVTQRFLDMVKEAPLGIRTKGGPVFGLHYPFSKERLEYRTPRGSWWSAPIVPVEDAATRMLP